MKYHAELIKNRKKGNINFNTYIGIELPDEAREIAMLEEFW